MELDPHNPEYLDSYCKSIRKLRREKDFLSPPSEKEIQLMEEAYQLTPDSPNILRSMATLYHDILKARNHDSNFTSKELEKYTHEEFVLKMKFFARLVFMLIRYRHFY